MYLKLLEKGYFETLCAIMVFYFTLTAVLTRIMVKKIMVSNNGIFIQLLFSSVSLERRRLDRIYEDGSSYIYPCKKTFDFYLIVTLFFAGIGPAEDHFRIVGLFLHKQFFIEGDCYGIHVDTIDEVRG